MFRWHNNQLQLGINPHFVQDLRNYGRKMVLKEVVVCPVLTHSNVGNISRMVRAIFTTRYAMVSAASFVEIANTDYLSSVFTSAHDGS